MKKITIELTTILIIIILTGSIIPNSTGFLSEKQVEDSSDSISKNYGYIPVAEVYYMDQDPFEANQTIFNLPSSWDWRAVEGINGKVYDYTTPIKNQLNCRSCYAFSAIGALESMYKIKNQDHSLPVDLSEQYIVSCYDVEGCQGGNALFTYLWMAYWDPPGALETSCFEYTGTDANESNEDPTYCEEKCENYQDHMLNVVGDVGFFVHNRLIPGAGLPAFTKDFVKELLITRGPVTTVMSVYDSFMRYDGGIYKHPGIEQNPMNINHQVVIVGYDDSRNCWICKNSWGTEWGEEGWFNIAYGDCFIDYSMIVYPILTNIEDKRLNDRNTIEIYPENLNFKNGKTETFTITNTAGRDDFELIWWIGTAKDFDWLEKCSTHGGVLDNGESVDVEITIDSRSSIEKSIQIFYHIFSNDGSEGVGHTYTYDILNINYEKTRSSPKNIMDIFTNEFLRLPILKQLLQRISLKI